MTVAQAHFFFNFAILLSSIIKNKLSALQSVECVFFSRDHHLGCNSSGLLYLSLLFGLLIVVCPVMFDFSFLPGLFKKLHLETFPNFIFEVYTCLGLNKHIWILQFIPVSTLCLTLNMWVFVYRRRYQSGITKDYLLEAHMWGPLPFENGCRLFVLLFQNPCPVRESSDILLFFSLPFELSVLRRASLNFSCHQTCFLLHLRFLPNAVALEVSWR